MVVVHSRGTIPISYSADLFSCASLVTIALYISAFVFPFLLSGWSKEFFPLTTVQYERPLVSMGDTLKITLTNSSGSSFAHFTIPESSDTTFIPLFQRSSTREKYDIIFSTSFYFGNASDVRGYFIEFPITARFNTSLVGSFNGTVVINQTSGVSLCGTSIYGALAFNQESPYSISGTRRPSPQFYEDYAKRNSVPTTESDSFLYGEPYFSKRSIHHVGGTGCTEFTINFNMQVPIQTVYVYQNIWYAFLEGWSTYIALAIPVFVFIWKVLAYLFGSGLLPAVRSMEAQLKPQGIPKFNRKQM